MSVDPAESCTIMFHQNQANKTQKMHKKERAAFSQLITVNTFMQCRESLSLSALIMRTNQCLLGWKRRAGPQWRPHDEGTHLLGVRAPQAGGILTTSQTPWSRRVRLYVHTND